MIIFILISYVLIYFVNILSLCMKVESNARNIIHVMGIFLMHLSAEVALITKYEQNVFYIAFWIQTKKLHQLNHMLLFFGGGIRSRGAVHRNNPLTCDWCQVPVNQSPYTPRIDVPETDLCWTKTNLLPGSRTNVWSFSFNKCISSLRLINPCPPIPESYPLLPNRFIELFMGNQ